MIDNVVDVNVLSPFIVAGMAFNKYYTNMEFVKKFTDLIHDVRGLDVDNYFVKEVGNDISCIIMFNSKLDPSIEELSEIMLNVVYAGLLRRCNYRTFDSIHELDELVQMIHLNPEQIMAVGMSNSSSEIFTMLSYDAPINIFDFGKPCNPDILTYECTDVTKQYKKYASEVLLNEKEVSDNVDQSLPDRLFSLWKERRT